MGKCSSLIIIFFLFCLLIIPSSLAVDGLPTSFIAETHNRTQIDLAWSTDYIYTEILRPNDNGTSADWVIVGGDTYNWQAVDDVVPDGATTRVRSTYTSGEYDSYNIDDLGITATIKEIRVVANVTTDTGTDTLILSIDGGTRYNSTSKSPSDGWDYEEVSHIWTTNPATSDAWTISEINNLEIGIEHTSSDGNLMCTQMYLEVTYYDIGVVVERNTSATWTRGQGTEVYNGTLLSYSDMGLWPDTTYYYQLWTYDPIEGAYSSTYLNASNTTTDNINVTLSNEDPADDSGNVDKDYTEVSVDIADGDGDLMNVTIEGLYVVNGNAEGLTNSTISANLITSLPYDTNIIWYVNVTDGYEWTNETYNFTTRSEIPYLPSEKAGESGLMAKLVIGAISIFIVLALIYYVINNYVSKQHRTIKDMIDLIKVLFFMLMFLIVIVTLVAVF